jgi:hypothetical protein
MTLLFQQPGSRSTSLPSRHNSGANAFVNSRPFSNVNSIAVMDIEMTAMDAREQEAAALKRLWDAYKKRNPEVTQKQLGQRYGIGTQGMVSQYLLGRARLDLEAALKFAAAFGCNVGDFSPRLATVAAKAVQKDSNLSIGSINRGGITLAGSPDEPVPLHPVRKLQVVATGKMLSDEQVELLEGPGGYVLAPTGDGDAYAIVMKGDYMHPAIRNGQVLVLEPSVTPSPGEFVLLLLKDGRHLVAELFMQGEETVTVMTVSGAKRSTFDRSAISQLIAIGAQLPASRIRKD